MIQISPQLFPEVIDVSSVSAKYSQPIFLPIAVEGQATGGTAAAGTVYVITRPIDADTLFGTTSRLSKLVKFLLGRGVGSVIAGVSVQSSSAPTLLQRQAVWQVLEGLPQVRIRLTDSTDQSVLTALAASCDNAALLYNKQVGFGGLATGGNKAAAQAAGYATASRRFVLVVPGIYDENGNLMDGSYSAATVAAEVSKNPDITDDLDLEPLVNISGIELDPSTNQPLFMEKVVSGVVQNDFEDLLQSGLSPLMTDRTGVGARISHLRMTWTGNPPGTDFTFDALETRLIEDQVFIDVRQYCYDSGYLRKPNTEDNRLTLAAGISALLFDRSSWISPLVQSDGTLGYNVSVAASADGRQVIVGYQGIIIRNITNIVVDATLSIPV